MQCLFKLPTTQVLLVAGGTTGFYWPILHTTEILSNIDGSWTKVASLPHFHPMKNLRGATLGNEVFMIGVPYGEYTELCLCTVNRYYV